MKAVWRWVIIIAGGVVALTLMGAGLLVFLVSRIDLKPEIERVVENATGRDLTIAGAVGVTFWPVLGVKAERATLSNVEGGRAPAFIAMDELDVGVEIRPLFDRRVEVSRLVLQRPSIALEVDAEGQPNWVLTPAAAATPPPEPAPSQPPSQSPSLREIRIIDGEAGFFDAREGVGWVVGAMNLTTAITHIDEPMHVEGNVRFNDREVGIVADLVRPGAAARGEQTPLKFSLRSELLEADFDGRAIASGELAGLLRASGPSLRQLAAWHGAPLPGETGLAAFAVSGRAAVGGGVFAFTNAAFSIDRIRGRGDFAISERQNEGQSAKPYVGGRVELFDFDLNPYLTGQAPAAAPTAEAAAASPAAAPTDTPTAEIAAVEAPPRAVDVRAAQPSAPIDFSGLQAISGDLEIVTHAVLVQHLRIDRARATLVLNDGFLAATVHEVRLYDGTGRGRFEIDARRPEVRMVQEFAFDDLDAQGFLRDAVNFAGIEGRAELSINVRANGRAASELVGSADGRVHLEIVSGVLHGVDLGGVSTTIRNALRGELIAPEARTPFLGFSGTFAVADGVLASNNLSFNTSDLRIVGVGVIDAPQRRLDMRLSPRSPRGGATFPFSIRGPWGQFSYAADLNGRVERELGARVSALQAASRAAVAN
jgi:AsmA protein